MKKIVFAFQVFGLIVMFPIYVVLEMNHGSVKLTGNNSRQGITGKMVKKGIEQSINTKSQNRDDIFYMTQKILFLNTAY